MNCTEFAIPRPRAHDDHLRGVLVERAAQAIAYEGYERLSLRRLAADAETSTSAIYSLFQGKDGLLSAVFEEATARLVRAQQGAPRTDDVLENVIALGRSYIDWAMANPELYRVMFMVIQGWRPSPTALEASRAGLEPLIEALARVPNRRLPADVAALVLWSGVHGFCSLVMTQVIEVSGEQFVAFREAALGSFARGVCG